MNAGLATSQWKFLSDGWESHIAVNVLSTALLSLLLLPTLVRTRKTYPSFGTPHLTILGSDVHADASLPERKAPNVLNAMNDEAAWEKSNKANSAERYSASKLLGMYGAFEVAKAVPMVEGKPAVIVDVIAPGFCKSELLSREAAPWILTAIQSMVGRTIEEGARTVVDGASRGVEAHGQYFDHQKIAKSVIYSHSKVRVLTRNLGLHHWSHPRRVRRRKLRCGVRFLICSRSTRRKLRT